MELPAKSIRKAPPVASRASVHLLEGHTSDMWFSFLSVRFANGLGIVQQSRFLYLICTTPAKCCLSKNWRDGHSIAVRIARISSVGPRGSLRSRLGIRAQARGAPRGPAR